MVACATEEIYFRFCISCFLSTGGFTLKFIALLELSGEVRSTYITEARLSLSKMGQSSK